MLEATSAWTQAYPRASVGVLAMRGVENPPQHPELDRRKRELERALREQYGSSDRKSLRELPVLAAYHAYYKKFGKTYHVQHQLESLVFKNRTIPKVAALVEAMFMAELKNSMLTAGHDLDVMEGKLRIDVASGNESYVRLDGENQVTKEGDMLIADEAGVISSILYGPDRRTSIKPDTARAVFTVYAPPGIAEGALQRHLEDIRSYVGVISPDASVEAMTVVGAG